MSTNIKRVIFLPILLILLLGFVLRSHNLTTWPRLGATFDEYAWTWLGMNLIQEGVPKSWSPNREYNNKKYVEYQKTAFWIAAPYLEHPPFFGIVAGAFAMANGASNMYQVTIDKIRPLALFLGVTSIALIFILTKEIYDKKIALLSSLIFATIPTIVIGSRILQNENFFIPSFLLSIIFIVKYLKTKKRLFLFLSALICGFLIIAKIPWVAAALTIVMILFYNKKYKDGLFVILISAIFFIGFLFYGYFYDWNLFINLWKLQLERYDLAFNSVYALFTEPYLVDRLMIDGWVYFGWFAFILLLIKDFKKNYISIFGILVYLAVFIFAIPNEAGHGWYRYPFYPFLAISLAVFIKDYFNKNIILTFMFILFIGLSLLELTWVRIFGFSFVVFRLFLFLSAIPLLPLFFKNTKLKKISNSLNYLLLLIIFLLNIWTVYLYNEQ